ncbi:MAG TPA: 30S ribosomal protein S16 [bacterium]|nr:30S ribosomal protein S16 [bacterium]
MLTLKFQRLGKNKQAHFRLIIQEKAKNPKSNVLEILGWYNPVSKTKELKTERIQYWLDKGAEATVTVHNFLVSAGLIKEEKLKNIKISKKRKTAIETKAKEKAAKLAEQNKKEEVANAEVSAEPVAESVVVEATIESVAEEDK